MPDDDTMLGQNLVEVRNQGRRDRMIYACHDPEGDWIRDQQIALCSNDHKCQAEADQHDSGCPVEAQLREEIGF